MKPGTPYPLVFVSSYSTFSNLAHTPKGSPSANTLHVYRLDPDNNSLTLLHASNFDQNLAFLRYSRKQNVLYGVSESIVETDTGMRNIDRDSLEVTAFSVLPATGEVAVLNRQSTEGKSACYITFDRESQNML
jgi:6-phosphogluconolactonase (cycloisomerase 2 family)